MRYFDNLSDAHGWYSIQGVSTNFSEGCFTIWCAFPARKYTEPRKPGDHE